MNSKSFLSYIFTFLLLSSCEFYPQDDSLFLYYPLEVGNKWQFKRVGGSVWLREVIGDTVLPNGRKYSIIIDPSGEYPYRFFERVDSNDFSIYRFEPYDSSEVIIDSLKALIEDTIFCRGRFYSLITFYDSLSYDTILGVTTFIKYFSAPIVPTDYQYGLAKGFGLAYLSYTVEDPVWPRSYRVHYYLQYARINGVEYGTLLDVKNEKLQAWSFHLSQNYPNPFNSQTRIEYRISNESFVTLRIFDILGREVETLVQSYQKPGRYVIPYSAERLSSGVYFLLMEAGRYSKTIKMVYMK